MRHVKSFAVSLRAPRRGAMTVALSGALIAGAGQAQAYLGGFESADGYQPFLNRVQEYNAGEYGANSGYSATSPLAITANTGLWEALSGGFTSGGATSYATGHQFYDRLFVNSAGAMGSSSLQGLVLTTGHQGWTGPALKYRYNLDTSDLGVNPATTGASTVSLSFWWCAQLAGPEIGGALPDGYFGDEITFEDASGNIGFRLGLTQRAGGDRLTYWDGTQLLESSIIAAANKYDRWDISLDMATNTFSASYFSFLTSTTTTLVTGAPMMNAMSEFTNMTFRTSPGVTNSKLLSVDDFTFDARPVPAPSSALVLVAAGAMMRRRRR